ncbi:hypothetical protein ACHAXR_009526 [Thalassiosira sp. AJA248-18]
MGQIKSVTNMIGMFNGATSFNSDLSTWDVSISRVTDMNSIFIYSMSFNGDLSNWNV